MLYRDRRDGLADVTLPADIPSLVRHLNRRPLDQPIKAADIRIDGYGSGPNKRIEGWDNQFIVRLSHFGVLGFCNEIPSIEPLHICGNCEYFGKKRDSEEDELCDEREGYQVCGLMEHSRVVSDTDIPRRPHVIDMSDFYAALRVPEDFGCIKWVEKKEGVTT
jgi:hypothetical protein